MSNPHPEFENAAPAAPVSRADAHAHPEASGQQPGATTTNTTTAPLAASAPAVATTTTTQKVPVEGFRLDDIRDDKKARAPGGTPRHVGPSLLSQALATARGIPQQQQQQTPKSAARPTPTTVNTTPNFPSRFDRENLSSHANTGSHDAPLRHADGRSGTPPTQPIDMAASAVVTTTAFPLREAASVPSSFRHSALANVRDILTAPRDILDHSRGRTSASLEIDRGDLPSFRDRPLSRSASPDNSKTPTKTSNLDFMSSSVISRLQDDVAIDPLSTLRPRHPQHKPTSSPEKTEKIWSIGSGDGDDEDGQVEKSVAEAMAGVEPNARSRKASYSLRFFKEGLPPEDKARRKDVKTILKEKLHPQVEEEHEHAVEDDQYPEGTEDKSQAIERSPSKSSRIQAALVFDDEPTLLSESPQEDKDYFHLEVKDSQGQQTPSRVQKQSKSNSDEQKAIDPVVVAIDMEPALVSECEPKLVEGRRESADSSCTETGEHHDGGDAEESGEEKISSAVFVPHQELSDACVSDVQEHHPNRLSRTRSVSQSKPHPWLVKADEPEPDIQDHDHEKDESPVQLSRLQSRDSFASRRGEFVKESHQDECAIEEVNVAAPKPQPVIHYETPVHEPQHHNHSQEPREAIELIPYKHQVGGHTTLWRFSRRAVCKQLNNRENEFYETIERYHRDLLPFLPRYVECPANCDGFLHRISFAMKCDIQLTDDQQIYRRTQRDVSEAGTQKEHRKEG